MKSGFRLTFVPVAQQIHHVEADGLVAALFEHGGGQTLVRPPHTWTQSIGSCHPHSRLVNLRAPPCRLTLLSDDLADAVEKASVARPEGTLVVDHLHLQEQADCPVSSTPSGMDGSEPASGPTFSVSMGQTTMMASATPAPRPHTRLLVLSRRPVASRIGLLSISNTPNLPACVRDDRDSLKDEPIVLPSGGFRE